jgi:hypothetical protein
MTTRNFNHVNKLLPTPSLAFVRSHMPGLAPSTMTNISWPPSCRSTPSNCTCCCILTPHTHLSDAAGYPHLNHIIRYPQTDTKHEVLAWLHCPHCPCTLGLTWVHPKEMPVVEEHVSAATWLPRMADFEGYTHLLDDMSTSSASECASPPMECCDAPMLHVALTDRTNGTNVPENSTTPSTPVVHRKPPPSDGPRKSERKPKPPARMEMDVDATPPYKPRKSKYDVR